MPRACGISSTPRLLDSITAVSGILDRPVKPGNGGCRCGARLDNVIASASEAIHGAASRKNGLLRRVAPRNDEALISANSLSSFAVDELHQAVLLRLLQASSFCFQVVDLLCGYRHGVGGHILAVDDVLEREHEI